MNHSYLKLNTKGEFIVKKVKKFMITILAFSMFIVLGVVAEASEPISVNGITINHTSPQEVGTRVIFTTFATGGTNKLYQYWIYDGTTWNMVKDYSNLRQFVWTPQEAGHYQFKVYVKEKGSTQERDAEMTIGYTIGNPGGGTYLIEPERWGIDGIPENNSNGINQALIWASQSGYTKIVFPTQEYIISENAPIILQNMRDLTIDLNDSVFQLNPNALQNSQIVHMADCRNVKLINGTLSGDMDSHDFTIYPGSTAGNSGIIIDGGTVDCQLDNITVKDVTGWGIITSKGGDSVSSSHVVSRNNLEYGGINPETGKKIEDKAKIRTINPINISEFDTFEDKFLILGVDKGYMGNPYLSTKNFDVIFYNSSHEKIGGSSNQLIYKKVELPEGTVYADFVFYQSNLPTGGDSDFNNAVMFITHYVQPTNLQITSCIIDNCKSLGMAICGGDTVTIKDCVLKNTGNLAPGYAVDLEDGWEYMTDIQFIDNVFENNGKDVVVCAGDRITFRGNKFSGNVYLYPRTTNYVLENNVFDGTGKLTTATYEHSSDTIIRGNSYINMNLRTVRYKEGPSFMFENETLFNSSITGMSPGDELLNSEIITEAVIKNAVWIAGTYRNCHVDVAQAQMISSKMYDCVLERLETNDQGDTRYERCIIKNANISSTSNTSSIIIKGCTITDTLFTVTTWGGATAFDMQDSLISMSESASTSTVKFSAGKARTLIFKNNTVSNNSSKPTLHMFDTWYTVPDAKILVEENTFQQGNHAYILDGVAIKSGMVRFTSKNNTIDGAARMLNPIYENNEYFIIDFDIEGRNSELEADKTSLEELYNQWKDITDSIKYTSESWEILIQAKDAAKAVLDNEDATQSQVDIAYTALLSAVEELTETEYQSIESQVFDMKIDAA